MAKDKRWTASQAGVWHCKVVEMGNKRDKKYKKKGMTKEQFKEKLMGDMKNG